MVIVKIKPFTYRLLQRLSASGKFESESFFRDGFYYIDIDYEVFRRLMEMDNDVNKAIIYAVLNFFKKK